MAKGNKARQARREKRSYKGPSYITDNVLIKYLQENGATDKYELKKAFIGASNSNRVLDIIDSLREKGTIDISRKRVHLTEDFNKKTNKKKLTEKPVPESIIGQIKPSSAGLAIYPISHCGTNQKYFLLPENEQAEVSVGDIVKAQGLPPGKDGWPQAKIAETIGKESDPDIISLIAMKEADLDPEFSPEVLAETEEMTVPELGDRTDLRPLQLITIDPKDARDFDDAVFAEPSELEGNEGGLHIIVAIADVAHYVRPGSALDEEAYKRGNSTYFPDRVVPMLPEKLSNGLCSLKPDEDRACLAVDMHIDSNGQLITKKIVRGLMRSKARLTYEQAEDALFNNKIDDNVAPIMNRLDMLHESYKVLRAARERRGALDIEMPERKIVIKDNKIESIKPEEHLESHKIIEELMLLANKAVAEELKEKQSPIISRVHRKPQEASVKRLREFLEGFGFRVSRKKELRQNDFNDILDQAKVMADRNKSMTDLDKKAFVEMVTTMVMKTQTRANYSSEESGHFGLGYSQYVHFTSPIRRYPDLIAHRAAIRVLGLGPDGLEQEEISRLPGTSLHVSNRERHSDKATKNATERYVTKYLEDAIGTQFEGVISKTTPSGVVVMLDEAGMEGFIPASKLLPKGRYEFDEKRQALIRRNGGAVYRFGATFPVLLNGVDVLSGDLTLAPANKDGAQVPGMEISNPVKSRNKRSPRGYRDFDPPEI